MRTCKKCHTERPIEEFRFTNKKRGWKAWECKTCEKRRIQKWYVESKQRIRQLYASPEGKEIREKARKNVANWQKGKGRDKHNANALHYYYRLQEATFNAYGGYKCNCCGETEPLFLTIDHVNNDGNKHRKKFQSTGDGLYKWLKQNGYPEGFQVLCMNCNHGKRRNGGICPHVACFLGVNKLVKRTCNDHPERE